jgi:hypothetical protein
VANTAGTPLVDLAAEHRRQLDALVGSLVDCP